MKLAVVLTGKTNEKYISDGMEIYAGRIVKYTAFEVITIADIKNTRNMPEVEQKVREGRKLFDILGKDDYCVLLDERGKEFTTLEFSDWMEKRMVSSPKRIVFVIGGPYGFSDEIYGRADFKISLSKLTFPHQLVRLLFMEQLYRVFTVIKGEPYHHE